MREAAILDAGGRRLQAEEIGLPLVFLSTLREWLRDGTPGHEHTRRYLARPPAGLVGVPNPWGIKVEALSDNLLGVLRGKGRRCR
jgi:hypothetical protein